MNNITGYVLTMNEAPNIERTLAKLTWLSEVVVLDSGSSDETVAIASRFPNVRVVTRAFTTHADQANYALEQTGITTEWVLALDADYVLTDEIVREIQALHPDPQTVGFQASFAYCIDGRPLRCGVYPPVTVLYRRGTGRYEQDGHAHRIRLAGQIQPLRSRIQHDDRKSIASWLASQARYMKLEMDKLVAAPSPAGVADRIRRWIVVAPAAVFVYSYFVRGGILDGRAGLFYAFQRTIAESILSLYLLRRKLLEPKRG